MAENVPDVESVNATEDHYRVRFRADEDGEPAETPDWMGEAARTISDGAEVEVERIGDDAFRIRSVLIERKPNVGEQDATSIARDVVREIRA